MDHPRLQAALRRFMDRGTLVWQSSLDEHFEGWRPPRRVFEYPAETEIPGMVALSRAVTRALDVIAAERPTPSTEDLFQSAFGHWRGTANGYEVGLDGHLTIAIPAAWARLAWEEDLRRFPSPLFRAILVAHCPKRSPSLDARARALIKETFWHWQRSLSFHEAHEIYMRRLEETGELDREYDWQRGYSNPGGLTVLRDRRRRSVFGRECSAHGLRYCGHCQWPRRKKPRAILEARYAELATAADWEPEVLLRPFGRGRMPAAEQQRYTAIAKVVAQLRDEGHTLEEIGAVTGRDRTRIHRLLKAAA